MNSLRTDLAIERHESIKNSNLSGVKIEKESYDGAYLTKITVETDEASKVLEKEKGIYYTAEIDGFPDVSSLIDGRLTALIKALSELIPESGSVLVAGLGNTNITPDALGPKCANMIFATRHIDKSEINALSLPPLREVSVISPGVTGQTGVEAAEVISCVCQKIKPSAVIAVDALAAADVKRLNRTVQIASSGISPGSGVKNARKALNSSSLGVPVVAVGVPTVVDALSLARGVLDIPNGEEKYRDFYDMMVTPRDIDTVIESASRLLALAINCALQKNMEPQELLALM
ncbi:MAG: GPR endopeptidase [Oscillospiraceae bacterium]|nr:GPR endopeptidase [Oscillospiraceae bacterium]